MKRMANTYMTGDTWWYWKDKISLPFMEKIGVGAGSYRICIDNQNDLHSFLRSDESLLMFANSQVDIAVIANLLNLNIWTFTYNRSNGHTPVWNTSSPDPELSLYTHYSHRPTLDVALYHSEDCHYDLLVRPDSPLVHIAARQHLEVVEQSQSQSQQEIEPPLEPEVLPDLSVDDVITEGITALRSILEDKNLQKISPLNFPPCPR